MQEWFATTFSGPMAFASILIALTCVYWALLTLGALNFGTFDLDVDFDTTDIPGGSGSTADLGFLTLKYLNLRDVPVMIWFTIFAFLNWGITWAMVYYTQPESTTDAVLIAAGSGVLSLLGTKTITQPLRGKFYGRVARARDHIGKVGTITSSTSPDNGQLRLPMNNSAPLLLNVRTQNGTLERGSAAEILDYDGPQQVYTVRPVPEES